MTLDQCLSFMFKASILSISSNILCLQVDKAVLRIMTDEQMANYIKSYGDRVAVLSFCEQTDTDKCSANKETLLQRLRDRIGTRKMKSKTKGALSSAASSMMARRRNTSAEKTSRKIEIGWLHYGENEYQQVRTRNGGGTRHASVEKTTTVAQILEMGKELFFPDGCSTKGQADDFTFGIRDFKRNKVQLDDTVGRLYEQTKLKILRFYICTKEGPSTDHSSSELNEGSEDSLSEDLSLSITEGADSQPTEGGSHIHTEDLITELQDRRQSSDSDRRNQVCGSSKYISNE